MTPNLPAHSPLGASACKRWKNCPGSVALCKPLPNRPSEFAAEGTVAHDLGEKVLQVKREISEFLGVIVNQEGFKIPITQEMIDAVTVYVMHINELRREDKHSTVLLEQKFHMKDLHEMLFGTSDATVYWPSFKRLFTRDYKHGAGVGVEVGVVLPAEPGKSPLREVNEQLLYYALGALLECEFPVETIDIGIVQPRFDHPDGPIRSIQIDVVDLMDWSADLVDWAKATEVQDAPLNPGTEQCRWCAAKPFCPALQEHALEVAKDDFPMVVSEYDPEKLAFYLSKLDIIENWCKAVRAFAYDEADNGRQVIGHKLVDKQARRYFKDNSDAEEALRDYGLDDKDIFEPGKLKSVSQIEKIKGMDKKAITDLWEKRSSGTTLVPDSDKRPAITCNAADDFKE